MLVELVINLLASVILIGAGFIGGKYRERRQREGENLEEYDFYPFGKDEKGHVYFDPDRFDCAARHFLRRRDDRAARQLILVGEQNDVRSRLTGEAPATNLVLDLKMRRELNQDKLNYELNIGARRFKCTTIPIFREGYGLVGAICINVDANFLTDEVLADRQTLETFIRSLCKTDMRLDENILSKDEYEKALAGKRHFRDFAAVA